MIETTSTATVADERARFRAFTAFGLAIAALMGGGVFATATQWLAMQLLDDEGSERLYFTGIAATPLVMGVAALWLAGTAAGSADLLARPVARASLVVAVIAVVGSVLLLAVTIDTQ